MINMFAPPGVVVAIALLAFWGMHAQNTATNIAAMQTQLDTYNYVLKQRDAQKQLQVKEIAELEKKFNVLTTKCRENS